MAARRFKISCPFADSIRVTGNLRVWVLAGALLWGMGLTTPALALGGILGPLVEPLEPITESAGDLLQPITEPVGEVVEPITEPATEILTPVTDPLLEPVEDVLSPVTDSPPEPSPSNPTPTTTPPPVPEQPGTGEEGGGGGATGSEGVTPAALQVDSPAVAADRVDVPLLEASWLLVNPDTTLGAVAPTASSSLLADVLEWVGRLNLGSVLAAPWLALQVLLRALASAGEGLLAPVTLLIGLATLMARERGLLGTKTA